MQRIAIYVESYHYNMIINGDHAYLGALRKNLLDQGFEVQLQEILPDTSHVAGLLDDYAIVENMYLEKENCVTLSRAHYVPFWDYEIGIEPKEFRLYHKTYDPSAIDESKAKIFANKLRLNNFGLDAPVGELGDAVLVRLQAGVNKLQPGQKMTTIDMLTTLRELFPNRQIIVHHDRDLHLKKQEEEQVVDLLDNLDIDYVDEPISMLMRKARFIAVQNSGLAFDGLVWGIPSLLFADADFHHACVNFKDFANGKDAVEALEAFDFDFDKYLKWYLDDHMISAQKRDSIADTMRLLQEFGWPVKIPQTQ